MNNFYLYEKALREILHYLNDLSDCNKRLLDVVYLLAQRIVELEEQIKLQQGN